MTVNNKEWLIHREALEKIRLHGSLWWKDKWGTPAKIAHDALNAGDRVHNCGDGCDPSPSTQ